MLLLACLPSNLNLLRHVTGQEVNAELHSTGWGFKTIVKRSHRIPEWWARERVDFLWNTLNPPLPPWIIPDNYVKQDVRGEIYGKLSRFRLVGARASCKNIFPRNENRKKVSFCTLRSHHTSNSELWFIKMENLGRNVREKFKHAAEQIKFH